MLLIEKNFLTRSPYIFLITHSSHKMLGISDIKAHASIQINKNNDEKKNTSLHTNCKTRMRLFTSLQVLFVLISVIRISNNKVSTPLVQSLGAFQFLSH